MIARLRRLLGRLAPGRRPAPGAGGVDLSSPAVMRDPYPHYAALRRAGSVHFLPAHGFWLVLGYDDVLHALKNPQHFSSARAPVRFDPYLNEVDPPAHTRARRAVAPFFSTAAIQALEGYTRSCARELLERGRGAAEFDLVDGYAEPVTERVVGRLLGMEHGDTEALRRRLAPFRRPLDPELFRLLEESLRGHLERSPGGPLLRGEGEGALSPDEAVGLAKLLWVAGTTTTSRLIATTALQLLRHPALRAEVLADPARVPAFVDEAVRLDAPEQMLWRVAQEGAELSGTRIPAGAEVRLCVAAANRDPAHFPDPDAFTPGRVPNPHLSFGAGPHFCPGTRLARMQARVAVEVLLEEWPDYAAARPLAALSYGESFDYRALTALPVVPAGPPRP